MLAPQGADGIGLGINRSILMLLEAISTTPTMCRLSRYLVTEVTGNMYKASMSLVFGTGQSQSLKLCRVKALRLVREAA